MDLCTLKLNFIGKATSKVGDFLYAYMPDFVYIITISRTRDTLKMVKLNVRNGSISKFYIEHSI